MTPLETAVVVCTVVGLELTWLWWLASRLAYERRHKCSTCGVSYEQAWKLSQHRQFAHGAR